MEGEKEEMEEGMMDKLKAVYNDPEVLGKLITVDGKKMSLKDFLAMAASGATAGMAKSGAGKTSSIGEAEEVEEGMMDKLKAVYNDPEVLGKLITVDGKKMSLKDFLAMAASGATAGMAKSGAGKTSSIGEAEKEDKMEEMMAEVEALRAELHEVNLLNAKLLYTNKIFRAKNLKEAQKVKVLEAFDKASNVKEVKLVFETLNEGIKETPKTIIKESLSFASKPAGVATKAPIMDIDPQVARWQKLAGIK